MTDNVHPLPDRLERLGKRAKTSYDASIKCDKDRIQHLIECATALAEARALFKDHAEFGLWCDEYGIDLNKDNRAALVAMGADPQQMRRVMYATDRRSLRHIHQNEWTPPFRQDGEKPPSAPAAIRTAARDARLRERQKEHEARARAKAQERATEDKAKQEQRHKEWNDREAARLAKMQEETLRLAAEREASRARFEKFKAENNIDFSVIRSAFPLTIEEYRTLMWFFHPNNLNPSVEQRTAAAAILTSKKYELTGEK